MVMAQNMGRSVGSIVTQLTVLDLIFFNSRLDAWFPVVKQPYITIRGVWELDKQLKEQQHE